MDVRAPQHGRDHSSFGSDPVVGLDATLNVIVDGLGVAIVAGIKGDIMFENSYLITAWTVLADTSGDIVIDVWKNSYGNFPPDVGDAITGSSKPTLTGQTHARDTTLDGWTTRIDAGDTLRFNVDSASAVTRVTVALGLTPV